MQVSIWSAFSSNHSSRFTVVGVFETPEQAQAAANKITGQLRSIVDWYHQPENADARDEWMDGREPSPPEFAIAEQLGIEWPELSLDWLWFDDKGHSPVKVVDNLVFIDGTESELGAHPADSLVRHVGGLALVDGDKDTYGNEITSLVLTLNCTTPDEAAAEAIEAETNSYLRSRDEYGHPTFQTPWVSYSESTAYSVFYGQVRRTGRELVFTGGFFHVGDGFPALLSYLRARGCTDIRYDFVEKNAIEEEE